MHMALMVNEVETFGLFLWSCQKQDNGSKGQCSRITLGGVVSVRGSLK